MTPYATTTAFTHENITAACPLCHHSNTFNRVTDLRDTNPVDLKRVRCQSCAEPFFINGDSINPVYEKLFFEACDSYRRKRYRECIIGLVTSLENLLFSALTKLLIEAPFANEHTPDWEKLSLLQQQLSHHVERWTFPRLRDAVINAFTHGRPATTEAAAHRITTLSPELDQNALARLQDPRLATLFKQLRAITVTDLRNNVLHKHAYRPTHDETARAVTETETVLYGVMVALRLDHDDVVSTLNAEED